MRPRRPPKPKGDCPKGGPHIPKTPGIVEDGWVTHLCANTCGTKWTRPQGKSKGNGKGKGKGNGKGKGKGGKK